MSDQAALERHYRRMLAWFPTTHRRVYGEEMIGVLMASAPREGRRPGIAETWDLARAAARVRLRHAVTGGPDPGWQDALAVSSVLAPLLMIVLLLGQNLSWMTALLWHSAVPTAGIADQIWPIGVLLIPLALGLLGLRRTAAGATGALIVWIVVQTTFFGLAFYEPRLAGYLILLAVQAVALAVSPGPRRALHLITPRAALASIPWVATAAYAGAIVPTHYPMVLAGFGIAIVILAAIPSLVSARARRVLVLLVAIPGSAFVVSLLTFAGVDYYSMSFAAAQVALYLPAVALAGLTVLAIRRSERTSGTAGTSAAGASPA